MSENVSKEKLRGYLKKRISEYEKKSSSAKKPDDYYYWLGQLNACKQILFVLEHGIDIDFNDGDVWEKK